MKLNHCPIGTLYFTCYYINMLLSAVKVAKDVDSYYAEKLYESMQGVGAEDDSLIRIVVGRSEVRNTAVRWRDFIYQWLNQQFAPIYYTNWIYS